MTIFRTWKGRWSDGKTAVAHEVEIELQHTNMVFRRIDQPSSVPHQWSYEDIRSPHPVHDTDDQVLLTSTTAQNERLFVTQENFAKRILDHAPNITHQAHQWSLLKWPLGIASALVLFWALTYFDIISPANSVARILPDTARITLGQGVVKTIRKDKKTCSTPQGDAALEKLLTRLYPATPKGMTFNIQVVDLNFVNAFAAPGDQIVVSGKLIEQADSPDEVAGVIAHEMGHSIERHPEAGIVRAVGLITLIQILTAGESGTFGDLAFLLAQSGYSRNAEQQADDHAAEILTKVSIDTRPLAGFFERLVNKKAELTKTKKEKTQEDKQNSVTKENKKQDRSFLGWLNTHPATSKRIEFFNQSERITSPPILSASEWKALQTICGPKNKKDQEKNEKSDET